MKRSLMAMCAALLVLPTITACSEPERAAPAAPSPAKSSGEESASAQLVFDRAHHMQASLWLAMHTRDAVIEGDLNEAKEAARALASHDYGNTIPEDWKKWIGDLTKGAEGVVLAGGIEDAGQGVGAIALACGNCHFHHNAGPEVQRAPPMEWRDSTDSVDERMERHSAGIAQMWAGLVEPSEEAWRSGTITLTRAPLAPPQTADGSVGPRAAAEIERVRELAKRARTAGSHEERAQIYGELVAGCGHCHTTTPRSM